jgi:hypothetical protein
MATTQDDCSGWARPSRLTAYDLQPILEEVGSNCECGPVCEWDRPRRLTTLELDEVLYDVYMDLYGEPI